MEEDMDWDDEMDSEMSNSTNETNFQLNALLIKSLDVQNAKKLPLPGDNNCEINTKEKKEIKLITPEMMTQMLKKTDNAILLSSSASVFNDDDLAGFDDSDEGEFEGISDTVVYSKPSSIINKTNTVTSSLSVRSSLADMSDDDNDAGDDASDSIMGDIDDDFTKVLVKEDESSVKYIDTDDAEVLDSLQASKSKGPFLYTLQMMNTDNSHLVPSVSSTSSTPTKSPYDAVKIEEEDSNNGKKKNIMKTFTLEDIDSLNNLHSDLDTETPQGLAFKFRNLNFDDDDDPLCEMPEDEEEEEETRSSSSSRRNCYKVGGVSNKKDGMGELDHYKINTENKSNTTVTTIAQDRKSNVFPRNDRFTYRKISTSISPPKNHDMLFSPKSKKKKRRYSTASVGSIEALNEASHKQFRTPELRELVSSFFDSVHMKDKINDSLLMKSNEPVSTSTLIEKNDIAPLLPVNVKHNVNKTTDVEDDVTEDDEDIVDDDFDFGCGEGIEDFKFSSAADNSVSLSPPALKWNPKTLTWEGNEDDEEMIEFENIKIEEDAAAGHAKEETKNLHKSHADAFLLNKEACRQFMRCERRHKMLMRTQVHGVAARKSRSAFLNLTEFARIEKRIEDMSVIKKMARKYTSRLGDSIPTLPVKEVISEK